MKMLCPLHLFFSWGLSGAAQGQTGGSFIRKKLYPLHLFFFDCYGQVLRGSWGFLGLSGAVQGQIWVSLSGKSYVHGFYFSLNTGGINTALD